MGIEAKRLGRGGIWLIIIGASLLLGSCLPAGLTIKRVMDAEVVYSQALVPGAWIETGLIDVEAGRLVQPAVKMQLSTESRDAEDDPQYRFPFRYEMRDEQGVVVRQGQVNIDSHSGSRSITKRSTIGNTSQFELEAGLEKLPVPTSGRISIRALLQPDEEFHARVDQPVLLVYDKVSHHLGTVLLGVGLWVLGGLILMIGMVLALLGGAEKGQSEMIDTDDQRIRNLAIWCHLGSLALYLGIPFGNLVGVLVFWLINRDQSGFIDWHGRESLNFQITLMIFCRRTGRSVRWTA